MGTIESEMNILTTKEIAEVFEERAVDLNMVLPDYYPPISAILKCIMLPTVTNRYQTGDRYSVDGVTTIRLLYVSEERDQVFCYEAAQPFSVSFASEQAVYHYTSAKVDYVNCRAVAPRRVDIHGAFRIGFKGVGVCEIAVVTDPHVDRLHCKSEHLTCSVPVCETEKVITVDEAVELGISADKLLYSEACVVNTECKVFTNKLIAKGVLRVKAVCSQDSSLTVMTQEIPFSQILDVDGVDERWLCMTDMTVGENETYMQQNEGGGAILFVKFKVNICARLMSEKEYDPVLDAYHCAYPLLCETTPITTVQYHNTRVIQTTETQQLSCPEQVVSCLDVWGTVKSYEICCENGQNQLCCCILIGLIAKDEDNHPEYYERTMDVIVPLDSASVAVSPRVVAVTATIVNHMLRVQVDLVTECTDREANSMSAVCKMISNEAEPFAKNTTSLRLVFAQKGESVWDIAKYHHAAVQEIMEENRLKQDVLSEPKTLMIPLL